MSCSLIKQYTRGTFFLLTIVANYLVAAPLSEQRIAYLAYADGYWQVFTMAPAGDAQRQITETPYDKTCISWYPGGDHLLVNGLQGELTKVSIDTGSETPIESTLSGMNDAVISPDGKYIAFSLSVAGSRDNNHIWLMDAQGQDPQKLTRMTWLQHDPVWGADGQSLYFTSGDGGQSHDIWRLSLEGNKLEQLTTGSLYHFDLAVSSQGVLAFSSNRSDNYEIWVQAEGAAPEKITEHPALDAKPTWSPDGKQILFESTRGGVPNLWSIDLETRVVTQLTYEKVGARAPAWRKPV